MTTKKTSFKRPRKPKADNTFDDDQRFEAADKVMSSGGYASTAPEKPKASKARNADKTYPTSWHATHADRLRINQIQGWMMMQGYQPNKTEILQMGLRALEAMNVDDVSALYEALLAEDEG